MIRLMGISMAMGLALASGQGIKHRFLAVDNGSNKLLLVDEIGGKGWARSIPPGSRDLQLIDGDKVLVSHGDGAAEYRLSDGAPGWSVTGYSGISTARRLANGNTLLGGSDGSGVTVYEIAPDKSLKSKHAFAGLTDLRLMRPLDNGDILLSLAASHKVVEVEPGGGIVWSAALTDKGYEAVRLPNGHTVATSGEDCRVYDLTADGKATMVAGGLEKHPKENLLWFSGFEILPNGHYFVANWNGHGMEGKGPHAVEFDAANNLVWKWDDHQAASTVTNVLTYEPATTAVRPGRDSFFRQGGGVLRFPLSGLYSAPERFPAPGYFRPDGRSVSPDKVRFPLP